MPCDAAPRVLFVFPAVRALQQRDGGEGRLFQDLPFPSVSSESVRVLCAGRVCVGNAEAGESPESVWSDLGERMRGGG